MLCWCDSDNKHKMYEKNQICIIQFSSVISEKWSNAKNTEKCLWFYIDGGDLVLLITVQ